MIALLALGLSFLASPAWATVHTAADCEEGTIQTLHDSGAVVTGDTISVPAGSCTWSTAVTVTKAITLQGAGVGQTIITNNVVGTMLFLTMVVDENTRLTGFEFVDGTGSATDVIFANANATAVHAGRIRIDHNKFDHLQGFAIRVTRAYGVIDHNEFLLDSNFAFYFYNVTDAAWADDRWAEAANYGGENFIFVEDNTFTGDIGITTPITDAYGGARFVFRYNTVTRGFIANHGTESPGRTRGARVMEVYENTFDNTSGNAGLQNLIDLRSGGMVAHNNSVTNWAALNYLVSPGNFRLSNDFAVFTIADGRNPWDNNHASNPFVSGTVTTATSCGSTTCTVSDSGKSWTTNEWSGYVLRQTSTTCNVPISAVNTSNEQITVTGHGFQSNDTVYVNAHTGSTPHLQGHYTATVVDANTITLGGVNVTVAGSGGYISLSSRGGTGQPVCSSPIISNTATQLTYSVAWSGAAQNMTLASSDAYEINLVTHVLDQPGSGATPDYAGVANPVPAVPFDQAIEPLYEWNNTKGVTNLNIAIGVAYSQQLSEGVDYFTDTVAPGYTAYTYPHPLVSGGGPPSSGNRRFSPMHNLRRASLPVWPVPYVNTTVRGMYAVLARLNKEGL